jgi:hypothetical protein
MFSVSIFLFLCALTIVANYITAPYNIGFSTDAPNSPMRKAMTVAIISKGIIISIFAVAMGTYMAPRIGINSPLLESIVTLNNPQTALLNILPATLMNAFYVLAGLLIIHVLFVGKNVSSDFRYARPLKIRVLQEGVLEGIVFRWALIPFIARILNFEFLIEQELAIIIALFVSALCSGFAHISDLAKMQYQRLDIAILAIISFNFWAAIFYGWMFWKFGFLASVMCHAIVISISALNNYFARPLFEN